MRKRNVCIWSFAAYCALMIWLLFGREQYHTVSDYWQQVALNFNPVPFETIVRFVGFLVGDYSDALKRHAIVNLVGNYVCISAFGYLSAGYVTLASNLVLTAMHYRNARHIEPEEVYDPKFSLLAVTLVTLGCLLCNLIYPFIALRYAVVAALLVFLWTQRKSVIDMLMNMKV